jgi:D-alanine-D-alanine ligase
MKPFRFHRVAVLMGGVSSEREISLKSGDAVAAGLREAGYDVAPVLLEREELPSLDGIEAAFVALHGRFGEDGGIQRLLDARKIPYTGSGATSSHISFDKVLTRDVLLAAGLPVAQGQVLDRKAPASELRLPLPVVVKPPREGSSVGISIVKTAEELDAALVEGRRYADELLVEAFIPGREWTVGIVGDEALPPLEIQPKLDGGWYSWKAKYFSNGTTNYAFPDDNPQDAALCALCRTLALKVFRALDARGLSRIDFRITPQGEPFVLELNAIPGFTQQSLLPKAAARAGIPFPTLCARIMETARHDG